MFDRATKAIADAAAKGTYNPDKPFSFDDYPSVKAYTQKIITGLANNITSVVTNGSRKQWLFACQKNDECYYNVCLKMPMTRVVPEKHFIWLADSVDVCKVSVDKATYGSVKVGLYYDLKNGKEDY